VNYQDDSVHMAENKDVIVHMEQTHPGAGYVVQNQDGSAGSCCASSSVIKAPPSPLAG
jgi:hypothetical protein